MSALRGVTFVAGKAEAILQQRVSDMANQFGVTERTIKDRYLTTAFIQSLADAIARADREYGRAVANVEPLLLGAADVGRVVAALGLVLKLATNVFEIDAQRVNVLGIATDASDAVVGMGLRYVRSPQTGESKLTGRAQVHARKVLQQAISSLREGSLALRVRRQARAGSVVLTATSAC